MSTQSTYAATAARSAPDFSISNHGSISLLQPLTKRARSWIAERVADEPQWFGGALVVEWRYAEPLVEALARDGMEVRV